MVRGPSGSKNSRPVTEEVPMPSPSSAMTLRGKDVTESITTTEACVDPIILPVPNSQINDDLMSGNALCQWQKIDNVDHTRYAHSFN